MDLKLFKEIDSYFGTIPSTSGCYAIYLISIRTLREKLIYIGKANNLKKRLGRHRIFDKRNKIGPQKYFPFYMLVKIFETPDSHIAEKQLIKKYKPLLNKAGIR